MKFIKDVACNIYELCYLMVLMIWLIPDLPELIEQAEYEENLQSGALEEALQNGEEALHELNRRKERADAPAS